MTWGKVNKKFTTYHVIVRDRFCIRTLCGTTLPVTFRPTKLSPPLKKYRCKLCNRSVKRAEINRKLHEGGKIVSRFNSKRILGGASDER